MVHILYSLIVLTIVILLNYNITYILTVLQYMV